MQRDHARIARVSKIFKVWFALATSLVIDRCAPNREVKLQKREMEFGASELEITNALWKKPRSDTESSPSISSQSDRDGKYLASGAVLALQ